MVSSLGPALGAVEVGDRLALVDAADQLRAHVLVIEAQRVAGLVPHHALVLRLRRAHGEAFEVHRRLVGVDAEDLRADVRPVAGLILRRVEPRDAHLADVLRLDELHVRGLGPRVHVRDDALAQVARRVVEELHGEMHAGRRPLAADHHCQSALAAAASGGRALDDALLVGVGRIDLDAPAQHLRGLLGGERARPAGDPFHGATLPRVDDGGRALGTLERRRAPFNRLHGLARCGGTTVAGGRRRRANNRCGAAGGQSPRDCARRGPCLS